MTTIAPGQLVLDLESQRIWRLIGPFADDPDSNRWVMEIVEDPIRMRPVGDRSAVSADWLQRRCVDYSTAVDPPKGDGPQVVRILDADGAVLAERVFTTADDMIVWLEDDLYPEQVGQWFGWDSLQFGGLPTPPDLFVKSVEGKLVWEEA